MDKRLIDAEALWHRLEAELWYDNADRDEVALPLVDDAPTVDAVEVVRCRDCKHYFHYGETFLVVDGKNARAGWCQRRTRYDEDIRMLPDDFCSYGEQREG